MREEINTFEPNIFISSLMAHHGNRPLVQLLSTFRISWYVYSSKSKVLVQESEITGTISAALLNSSTDRPTPQLLIYIIHQFYWYPLGLYENKPIQIYWKFYHQKMKIFR